MFVRSKQEERSAGHLEIALTCQMTSIEKVTAANKLKAAITEPDLNAVSNDIADLDC